MFRLCTVFTIFKMKNNLTILLFFYATVIFGQTIQSAHVADYLGRPTIFINNIPHSPQIYALPHVYGGRWSWEERPARNLANFCELGIQMFQVDLYLEDIWYKGAKTLDMAKAQRQIQGVLDVCPNAAVFVRFHVNSPFWWNEMHPEECTVYANGPVDNRRYGPPFNNEDGDIGRARRASLASVRWRTEAGEKLREFCVRLAKTKQGKAVAGLHIAGGVYGEWHYWGFMEHEPDTGPAMTAYFRQWLFKRYTTSTNLQNAWKSTRYSLETATIPDTTERNFNSDGVFRDPLVEQRVADYYRAQQEVVVEDIEFFVKIAKSNWPRPLIIGVFYGYFHSIFSRQAAGGHILIERIMDNPNIDYLAAPQSYWEASRKLGGAGISRGIVESARLHGKLWLDEMDNGYLQQNRVRDFVRMDEMQDTNYAQILERSTNLPMMRGAGFWYYDFGPLHNTGWWDSPYYQNIIRQSIAFWKEQLHQRYQSSADVLYVYDQSHYYYSKNKKTAISTAIPDKGVEDALHSGATGDHVYLFDLPKINPDQYKAVVFVNCFAIDSAIQVFIREKIAANQRTLIWNYLPGYIHEKGNGLEHVMRLTGFRLATMPSPDKPAVETATGTYELSGPLKPLATVRDTANVAVIGRLKGDTSSAVIIGRQQFEHYTSLIATVPLQSSELFRSLLQTAGCHIYTQSNDFTFANGSFLLLHTATGGERTIVLKNGKIIKLELERAETLLLDSTTGQILVH